MDIQAQELPAKSVRLLSLAVADCGRTISDLARRSGLKRDTVRRSIAGDRDASLAELVAILDATGISGEQALLFMLLVDDEFAIARSGTSAAQFLVDLLRLAPVEIVDLLGEDIQELRPRWAAGTAKLLARTLSQHVADLNRRGEAIGERFAPAAPA